MAPPCPSGGGNPLRHSRLAAGAAALIIGRLVTRRAGPARMRERGGPLGGRELFDYNVD
jgi:hypothetical protein